RLISVDEGLLRLDPNRLEQLFKPVIKEELKRSTKPATRGLNASPGAAVGRAVFTADAAREWAEQSEQVILVRRETTPDDYHGMVVSQGILTSAGGTNSHAAVVARGEGIPAVCGADAIRIDMSSRSFAADGTKVEEGDVITIDGFDGTVYAGELPLEESRLEKARAGDAAARDEKIWKAFERLMAIADDRRRLRVRANADTPDQSANARARGAEGIGLCRTEHMFLGEERVDAVRQMIFAESEAEEEAAYQRLLPLQKGDFVGIFEAMDGLPVTVRLLDPPLHEFLPPEEEATDERMRRRIRELDEANPMLGTRGCRLGLMFPEIYEMQVRAIVLAAKSVQDRTGEAPLVEIMHPLVAFPEELRRLRELTIRTAAEEADDVAYLCGTMIELPRACLRADEIAEHADFFSFGTNDLTQTALGFSRDDAEGTFLTLYLAHGILERNPFETIDLGGVGELMRIAVERGRSVKDDLKMGICGEHGGEARSVAFCHELGLDYVSCSPFRVPLARLAAAQAALEDAGVEAAVAGG
ncbi:MAG TPA: putative PEP-binding protein, partial [Gaiellaceae bacterium]|nr:putative PEP-binding protein [Gaiellaceae bacterium]